jgi:hypothetical protein
VKLGESLGLAVMNVLFNDERDEDVCVEQGGGHLVVLKRANVFGGDSPAQPQNWQSGRGAVRQPRRPASHFVSHGGHRDPHLNR